ncbi:MAG TPA: hypothetical protein VKJ07_10965, partial [Mycobacteriales bacterium]|nr:hypothetical protein [Mycobacteriales bacterium]
VMTIIDLKNGWRTNGFSHFGLAWIAMAFTCGPHHLEHGLHAGFTSGNAGALDLLAVGLGAPAGLTWFYLRVEALFGGRGDRFIPRTPRWVGVLPWLGIVYVAGVVAALAWILSHGVHMTPRITPNILLLFIYSVIGYYLLRTQLVNHGPAGGWSLSGLALTIVFPTCGVMHAIFAAYAVTGSYGVESHGLVIDWLAVPAAIYFVWVVRALHLGAFTDWNEGAEGARPQVAIA